ncbi:HlyC/CorC family transporter [Egibacter rhizosphaerae]|uniref:HlyC/CorC family transporter n=1 Tax=Egibacter rhizosphaerae TaxID=1670831 RepID=A0A411YBQ2_9ACTN|nr:hemolysin family protein [Egibacter rhizosphaerae]QBI18630.1 HlyC/CorC family transporter [Egibacter rhizosphaerae]
MIAWEPVALVVAAVLVFVAALLAAAQAALSRLTLPQAQRFAAHGRRGATALVKLMLEPARTANILALVVLTAQVTGVAAVTGAVTSWLMVGWAVVAVAVVGSTLLFVAAEVAPKTVALQAPERTALALAPLVAIVIRPLAPVAAGLIRVSNVLVPGRGLVSGPFVTEDQLRAMIDAAESDEVIESNERAMIHSIFELGDTVVREIMVPRPDMVCVSLDQSLSDVLDVVLRAGHSRIPVYRGDRDTIVGLLYAKDVLRRLHAGGDENGPWSDLLRPAHFVPELKRVDALLAELQAKRIHLAIVVDEYGATAGIVTIEDILEEIVGEIEDEYDRSERMVEPLDDGHWRVDARLPVHDLADLVEAELPDEEWDTVGGLLVGLLGHVAEPGEEVEVAGVRLSAERVKGRRVAKVLVTPGAGQPVDEEDARA